MGWNRKVGRRNKDFKKCVCVGGGGEGGGGGTGSRVGALKRRGLDPLTNYGLTFRGTLLDNYFY